MSKYSDEFKEQMIQRLMPPHNESVSKVAKESGVPEQTLYKWQRRAREAGAPVSGGFAMTDQWSSQQKFAIVLETAALSAAELAEYCRAKGLFVEHIEAWRDACMHANGGTAKEVSVLHKQLREQERQTKQLERDLRRKEAALAETAALLVLRKKAESIWGDPEGK